MRKKNFMYSFVLPALLVIVGILIIPLIYSFYVSFHEIRFAPREYTFLGIQNYLKLITDKQFLNSLKITMFFAFITVFCEVILGVLIALILNKDFKGRSFVRGIMILPWALPTVVNAVMWKWIFNADYGILNYLLNKFGYIHEYRVWLGKPVSAFLCITVADIWKETPYVVLLILAALSTISPNLYEAARIDGASAVQIFRKITLPLIKGTILVVIITKTIWAFKAFDLIYIMTSGGPAGSTELLSFYIYKNCFKFQKFGYASAMSYMLSALCFILTIIYIKILSEKENSNG